MSHTNVNLTLETDRIERAYRSLAAALRTRDFMLDASKLDDTDLDLVIADLVSLRHGRLAAGRGYHDKATAVTVVVERAEPTGVEVDLASFKSRTDLDEFGRFAHDAVDAAFGLVSDSALRESL